MDKRTIKKNISENLKFLRKKNNMSQAETAVLLGVSTSTYQKYEFETYDNTPTIPILSHIADVYNMSIDALLGKDKIHVENEETQKMLKNTKHNFLLLRIKTGLSVEEIAQKIGISKEMYLRYEQIENIDIPTSVLIRVADIYHITVDELLSRNTGIWRFINECEEE